MAAIVDDTAMAQVARDVLGRRNEAKDDNETFRGFFGAPIHVLSRLWNLIAPAVDLPGAEPKHMLWALVFVKVYSTEAVHRRIVGWPDAKTYRKWCWYMLEKIASTKAEVIQLDKRFEKWNETSTCLMSLDGVDLSQNL